MKLSPDANGRQLCTDDAGNVWDTTGGFLVSRDDADDYTLVLSDAGRVVRMTSGSANNLTIPLNSNVAFPLYTQIVVLQEGAGQTTIAGAVGTTLNSLNGNLKISGQYGMASLLKIGTDTWVVAGNLTA